MADNKTLQTRISLKIDTWANWTNTSVAGQGGNLVLKRGEVAFVQVDTKMPPVDHTESGTALLTNPNAVLFKVGDGVTAFKDLKWGSAIAADVHDWAKKSETEFKAYLDQVIADAVKNGDINLDGYATDAELAQLETSLTSAINGVLGSKSDLATADTVYGAKAAAAEAKAAADTNATAISALQTEVGSISGKYATIETVNGVTARVAANENAISGINDTIAALGDTYATDEELADTKAALETSINAKVDQTTYTTKVGELESADEALDERLSTAEGKIASFESASATYATKTELNTAKSDLVGTAEDTDASDTIKGAKKYADKKVADLVNGAPETLDTLSELASALKNNADIVDVLEASIATKANQTALNAIDTRVGELEKVDHDHENKTVLDGITAQNITDWNDAVSKEHTHSNKAVIDGITAAQVTKWDGYATGKANVSDVSALTTRVETIEGDYLKAADYFYIDCGTSTTNIN